MHIPTNMRVCDIFGHRYNFDAFSTMFDRPLIPEVCVFDLIPFQGRFQIGAFLL